MGVAGERIVYKELRVYPSETVTLWPRPHQGEGTVQLLCGKQALQRPCRRSIPFTFETEKQGEQVTGREGAEGGQHWDTNGK